MSRRGKRPRLTSRVQLAVEYGGQTMCLKHAAVAAGLSYWTVYDRYRKGERGDALFRAPAGRAFLPTEQHENGDGV